MRLLATVLSFVTLLIMGCSEPVTPVLEVTPGSLTLASGQTLQLTVTRRYPGNTVEDVTSHVTYASSSRLVAAVDATKGLVTAGDQTGSAIVRIVDPTSDAVVTTTLVVIPSAIQSIDITPSPAVVLKKGEKRSFTATAHLTNGSLSDVTSSLAWSAANDAIASVGNTELDKGVVTALTAGTTEIVALDPTTGVSGRTTLFVNGDATFLTAIVVSPNPRDDEGRAERSAHRARRPHRRHPRRRHEGRHVDVGRNRHRDGGRERSRDGRSPGRGHDQRHRPRAEYEHPRLGRDHRHRSLSHPRALPPLHRRALGRLAIAVSAGVVGGLAASTHFGWLVSLLAGWDLGTVVFLVLCWLVIGRADAKATKARAAAEDPGRSAVWVIVSFACFAGFFASAIVLRRAKQFAPEEAHILVVLCLAAVICAWLLAHTTFALRYAHLYYRPTDDGEGGLEFPGKEPPDDFDFAYFAFTVGMCFQVSDVTISDRTIRRNVLLHALIAFGYNTAIVALALNLLVNLIG